MLMKVVREGFTLVELSLAMLFIGVLSVSIVLIITNTVAAYQRGLTLSRVNSTGSSLADDMLLAVQNSSVKSLLGSCTASVFRNGDSLTPLISSAECISDKAYNYVSVTKVAKLMTINGTEYKNQIPIYGAFCTGSYSYAWNSGYFESEDASFDEKTNGDWIKIQYLTGEEKVATTYKNSEFFRLIKVQDNTRAICMAMVDKTGKNYRVENDGISNLVDVTTISYGTIKGEIVDLLPKDGGNDLTLYDLEVAKPAVSTSEDNIFYSVSMILGTVTGGVNIMARGNSCAAPNDAGAGYFNYCAINKFNFAIQVNGG